MAIDDVTVSFEDGGLGILPESTEGLHVKLGCSSSGTAGVLVAISEPADAVTAFGEGPLVRAVAHALASATLGKAPRPVYAMKVAAGTAGACGGVVKTAADASTGTVSAAGSAYDRYEVRVLVTRTGTLGAGAFRYSLDGGDVYSDEVTIPGGGTYELPSTGVTLTFTAGGGPVYFEADDVFAFTTIAPVWSTTTLGTALTALYADPREWEFMHLVGPPAPAASAVTESGTSPPDVTVSGTAVDHYIVQVEITTGGNRGTAVFRYSLDAGATWAEEGVTTAATYAMPGTGLTLAFATGTAYSTDNVYTFHCGNISALESRYSTAKSAVEDAEASDRFVFAILEAAPAPDAALIAATLASCPRLCVVAGDVETSGPLDARLERRSAAWPVAARLAATGISEDLARTGEAGGLALARVTALYRDEQATEGLDAAKFVTLRRVRGLNGSFVTAGRTFAGSGSDFTYITNRRVLDTAARIGLAALQRWRAEGLRVDATTGYLLETEARRVESYVEARVRTAVVTPGHASACQIQAFRTDNILSTSHLRVRMRVTPLGYARSIELIVGFANPALAAA